MTQQAAWNAEHYHVVSRPHEAWGSKVLGRIPTGTYRTAMDAGCGTGKITKALLDLLPEATVVAVDYSAAMLEVARAEYAKDYGDRVRFRQLDLSRATAADVPERFDLIFSTATFHWIHDHDRLFRLLFDLLNPGGWLVAQCGGGPNLAEARRFANELMQRAEFASAFAQWNEPWIYEDDVTTAQQLAAVGFTEIETDLEAQPTDMHDAETYRQYVRTVIFREHLAAIGNPDQQKSFVEAMVGHAGGQTPPWQLDYWRLNMRAQKPLV
ncbi:MAG TPA: methyltransferase domain-containing protein [Thermomicrobiales bacterium]|nr:methyltransferase domain-containing protein [Thermomicrobiales bacterium]